MALPVVLSEDEGDLILLAGVAQPVPVERRLSTDDEIGSEGLQLFKEIFELPCFEVLVQQFLCSSSFRLD